MLQTGTIMKFPQKPLSRGALRSFLEKFADLNRKGEINNYSQNTDFTNSYSKKL